MQKIKVFIDGGCDIDKQLLKDLLLEETRVSVEYLYNGITINYNEYVSDPSWELISKDTYLSYLNKGYYIDLFQPSLFIWKDAFEKALNDNFDILYISISQRYAGGYKQASTIKKLLSSNYPNRVIEIIDSKTSGAALKLLILKILKELNQNKTINLSSYADFVRNNYLQNIKTFWICDSLKYIMYTGRSSNNFKTSQVPKGSPLMASNEEGLFNMLSLCKNKENSLETLFKTVDSIKGFEFTYTPDQSLEEITPILDKIQEHYKQPVLNKISFIGPTIMAITGPKSYSLGIIY